MNIPMGDRTDGDRTLKRCEEHGLAFDPARETGCVLCRSAARSGSAGRAVRNVAIASVAVVITVTAGYWGVKAWRNSRRAQVGLPCEAAIGCVEGADCLTFVNFIPMPGPSGTCFARCESDHACPPGMLCLPSSGRHCVPGARLGQECGPRVLCEQGALCVDAADGRSFCRETCAAICEEGFLCTPIRVGAPANFWIERVCMPVEGAGRAE